MFLSRITLISLIIFSTTVTVIQSMNPRTNRNKITWHVKGKSGVTKLPDRATKDHQKKYKAVYQQLEDDFSTHKPSSMSNSSQRANKLVDEVGTTIKNAIKEQNTIFDIIKTLSKEIDPIKNSCPHYMCIGTSAFSSGSDSSAISNRAP